MKFWILVIVTVLLNPNAFAKKESDSQVNQRLAARDCLRALYKYDSADLKTFGSPDKLFVPVPSQKKECVASYLYMDSDSAQLYCLKARGFSKDANGNAVYHLNVGGRGPVCMAITLDSRHNQVPNVDTNPCPLNNAYAGEGVDIPSLLNSLNSSPSLLAAYKSNTQSVLNEMAHESGGDIPSPQRRGEMLDQAKQNLQSCSELSNGSVKDRVAWLTQEMDKTKSTILSSPSGSPHGAQDSKSAQ